MRPIFITLWLVVVVLACRAPDTSKVNADVGFAVSSLAFARTLVGQERALSVTVENRGRAPALLRFGAQGPFFVAPGEVEVAGGSTAQLTVTFRPSEAGEVSGLLEAAGVEGIAPVALTGEGMREEACAPSSLCVGAAFDVESATCVETPVTDGTACVSLNSCIPQGQCFHGECKGEVDRCDDNNRCTTDACAPGEGCVHFDASAECPAASDACHVPVCDSLKGCQWVEAADGIPCGPSDCNRADICMAGVCKSVVVPEGAKCGTESPCQAKGICHLAKCEQPAATKLSEAWHYEPPSGFTLQFQGVADAAGNLYAVECKGFGDDAFTQCQALSFAANGALRFKSNVPLQISSDQPRVDALQLLVGNVFVFSPTPTELFAFSTVDGQLLWRWPILHDSFVALRSHILQSLAAGFDGSLWVVTNSNFSEKPLPPLPTEMRLHVFNAIDGVERWNRTELNRIGSTVVLDASNRGYLTVAGTGADASVSRVLEALGSTGQVRWSRPVPREARAVFNGRVELANGQTLASADGADAWSAVGAVEMASQFLSTPLMTSGGIFEPLFTVEDCADDSGGTFVPAYVRLAVAFRANPAGILQGGTEVFSAQLVVSYAALPLTSPSLTDGNVAVLSGQTQLPIAVPVAPSPWLRGIDKAGQQTFACELPTDASADATTYFGVAALLNERWATVVRRECSFCDEPLPNRLVVFNAPGLRPAQHGWTAAFGNASRDNRER